jgi:hypothetical protein
MKAYGRSGGIAPLILKLGSGWRWVVTFTPRSLYRFTPSVVGWVGLRTGLHVCEKRKMCCPCRDSNEHSVFQPAAWSLYGLRAERTGNKMCQVIGSGGYIRFVTNKLHSSYHLFTYIGNYCHMFRLYLIAVFTEHWYTEGMYGVKT